MEEGWRKIKLKENLIFLIDIFHFSKCGVWLSIKPFLTKVEENFN